MNIRPDEVLIEGTWTMIDGRYQANDVEVRARTLAKSYLRKIAAKGWTSLYVDPSDGRYWQSTFPKGWLHGGGPMVLRCVAAEEARAVFGDFKDEPEAEVLAGPIQRLSGNVVTSLDIRATSVVIGFGREGFFTSFVWPIHVASGVTTARGESAYQENLFSLVGSAPNDAGVRQDGTIVLRFEKGTELRIPPPASGDGVRRAMLSPEKPE